MSASSSRSKEEKKVAKAAKKKSKKEKKEKDKKKKTKKKSSKIDGNKEEKEVPEIIEEKKSEDGLICAGVTTEDVEVKVEDVPITESTNDTKVNTAEGEVKEGGGEAVEAEENNPTKKKRKRKRKKKGGNNPDEDGDDTNNNNGGSGATIAGGNSDPKILSSVEHTIFVEGIPFDSNDDIVMSFFVNNGCPDVLQMRLPKWQDTGRLRGFGHIVFRSKESRQKALTDLDGLHMGKRYLTIRPPNDPKPGTTMGTIAAGAGGDGAVPAPAPREQPDGCNTVFIRNLPYDATEDDIKETFRPCGKIVDGGVRLARNYSTRESKGFGYVEFKNVEGAYSAVRRASKPFGIVVGGRPCFVDYEEGTMKGSFRDSEGKLYKKDTIGGKGPAGGRVGGRPTGMHRTS